MATTTKVTRADVWVHMLLYPRHTLPTALAPVAVGSALAWHDGVFAALPAAAALLAGWLVQLGGVITDNYNNLRRHGDDREHPAFVEALRTGIVTFRELQVAILSCFAVAALVGLYLAYVGGLPAVIIGLCSILAAVAYSSGPYPLGDNFGMGDPLFFTFFGIVSVVATYFVQAAAVLAPPLALAVTPGTVTATAFLVSLPVAALTTNILVIDNIRDLEFDREKNERTLAVIIGRRWSYVEFVALDVLAYAMTVWLWWGRGFSAWALLPLASVPYAVVVALRVVRASTHEQLILMTPQQGQVLMLHAALSVVGLVASR